MCINCYDYNISFTSNGIYIYEIVLMSVMSKNTYVLINTYMNGWYEVHSYNYDHSQFPLKYQKGL